MDDLREDYRKTGLYFVSTSPAAKARDLNMPALQQVTGMSKSMLAGIINDRRKAKGLRPIGFKYVEPQPKKNTPIILPDVQPQPQRWTLKATVKGKPTPPPKPIPAPTPPAPGPDRMEALEAELAALKEMVAALRAEVAYLTGEVHWLTYWEDEEDEDDDRIIDVSALD